MRKRNRSAAKRQSNSRGTTTITMIRSVDTFPGVEVTYPYEYVIRDSAGMEHRFGTRQERDQFARREAHKPTDGEPQ